VVFATTNSLCQTNSSPCTRTRSGVCMTSRHRKFRFFREMPRCAPHRRTGDTAASRSTGPWRRWWAWGGGGGHRRRRTGVYRHLPARCLAECGGTRCRRRAPPGILATGGALPRVLAWAASPGGRRALAHATGSTPSATGSTPSSGAQMTSMTGWSAAPLRSRPVGGRREQRPRADRDLPAGDPACAEAVFRARGRCPHGRFRHQWGYRLSLTHCAHKVFGRGRVGQAGTSTPCCIGWGGCRGPILRGD
jgi:hypothetical protein